MLSKDYNSVAFTPEEVKKGLHSDLINYLVNYNTQNKSDDYYEIHITSDGYCMIIEFDKIPYDHAYGGTFKYVDEFNGDIIMKECYFPDNHTEICYDDEDFKERLDNWLKENPGWRKNEYGSWYNEEDQKAWKKYLEDKDNS